MYPTAKFRCPHWITEEIGDPTLTYTTLEARMDLVIRLAERNIQEGGGPFGAAVFEIESGTLIAPGVNQVVPSHSSLAHAEAVAIATAQQALQTHDLSRPGLPAMELVTSAQPCIQCYGILWWSGLSRVVIGANHEDVESLTGFHEGPLPQQWADKLENRPPLPPIKVIRDVRRSEARRVLRMYRKTGGIVYNPGAGAPGQSQT
jgi:tRNA(Arg) A34 adenosine deaminase TadA